MNVTEEKRGRVLIVEDEDTVRLSLRQYLRKKGYKTFVATNGLSAVKELLDEDVDVIVSDYKMAVFGGDYWIRFLKKHYSSKKIIITSGFLKPDFHVPFPVLFKPFDYCELEARIAEHLVSISSASCALIPTSG